jgi:phospholipid/cholesterol/gamma-HCH transport system permease protein
MTQIDFIDPIRVHVTKFDMISGLIKAFAFGIIIVTISCYRGMTTTGGAAGVGRATTNSVVICYSIILLSNFFITLFLNESHDYLVELFARW